tara:strand:+ start:230 stop:412 length:183 start_codon:yes stop_codon:yes gene_type:complete
MVINRIDEPNDEDLEWYSICCTAPPLYDLHDLKDGIDPIGICMNCREHTGFEQNLEYETD